MIMGFLELAAARPTGGEGVKSGPIALATILVLCVVAYFLFKSMSKHLKKVRDEFPTDRAEPPGSGQWPDEGGGAPSARDEQAGDPTGKPADDAAPRTEVPPDSSP